MKIERLFILCGTKASILPQRRILESKSSQPFYNQETMSGCFMTYFNRNRSTLDLCNGPKLRDLQLDLMVSKDVLANPDSATLSKTTQTKLMKKIEKLE